MMWVKCEECGYEMVADLKDCCCEQCEAFCWSAPFSDGDKSTEQEES